MNGSVKVKFGRLEATICFKLSLFQCGLKFNAFVPWYSILALPLFLNVPGPVEEARRQGGKEERRKGGKEVSSQALFGGTDPGGRQSRASRSLL